MSRSGAAVTLAAVLVIALYLSLKDSGAWGLNHLGFLTNAQVIVWTACALVALFPPLFRKAVLSRWYEEKWRVSAWAAGAATLLVVFLMPVVEPPLLGDGLDRLEATLAGLKGLEGRPAPLDLLIHLIIYKTGLFPGKAGWTQAVFSWRFTSHLAGALAAGFLWKLADLRSSNRGERLFLFTSMLGAGTAVFFLGYVENYVLLAAAVYGYLLLLEAAGKDKAPAWSLAPALVALVSMHYFMVFLAPATAYALARAGIWKPRPGLIAAGAAALAAFAYMAASMVDQHYGGMDDIFVSSQNLFSRYHLWGFLNQQILAAPSALLLLPLSIILALYGRRAGHTPGQGQADVLLSFTGAASVLLAPFFFMLRPVIGPAADWDLFAIPSLFYLPWMALMVQKRARRSKAFPQTAWAVIVVTVFTGGVWVSINTSGSSYMSRYKELMEWEARYNPWAASYGYLKLGKFLGRSAVDRADTELDRVLERALQINPDSATLRKQAAGAWRAAGRKERADEQMARHHWLMGSYYRGRGMEDKARAHFKKALSFDPDSKDIRRANDRLQGPSPK